MCFISVVYSGTGSSLSPLGLAASSAPGMIPLDDDSSADLVSVVGKGTYYRESVTRVSNVLSVGASLNKMG